VSDFKGIQQEYRTSEEVFYGRRKTSDNKARKAKGVTRRQFLTTVGASAAVRQHRRKLAADTPKEPELLEADETARITLSINGRRHHILVEPRWSLLYVLRRGSG